jgi:hypothetical protein
VPDASNGAVESAVESYIFVNKEKMKRRTGIPVRQVEEDKNKKNKKKQQ